MRYLPPFPRLFSGLFVGLMLAALSVTAAAETPADPPASTGLTSKAPKRTVFLNKGALEELSKSNPGHYAEAQRVMAAASTLCAPGHLQTRKALRLPEASCREAFLRTSYPPKREISFQLDETRYVTLVTVRDAAPEMYRVAPYTQPGDDPAIEK